MMEPFIPAIMLLLGLSTHLLKDLARIQIETGTPPHPIRYWSRNPYQTLICVIGAAAGYFALQETGQLTGLTAFGMGYMANSVADILGKRATERL